MSPNQTPDLIKKIYPSLIWEKKSQDELFLTFDDGPHPEVTPWILDLLDHYQAKATFFCVGENLAQFNQTAIDTVNRGHKLGNHTNHHENGWKTKTREYLKSIYECNELFTEIQRRKNELFRPPYGRIKRSQILELKSDYRIIMWSHLAGDFKKKLDVSKSIRMLKKTRPGSIIVFHDNEKSFENLKAILPACLEHWSSLNYKFSVIS